MLNDLFELRSWGFLGGYVCKIGVHAFDFLLGLFSLVYGLCLIKLMFELGLKLGD